MALSADRLRSAAQLVGCVGLLALCSACADLPPETDPVPRQPASPDVCKPYQDVAPEVIVGHGFSDFLPADDFDVSDVEAGPQGGFHIWLGARVKNLARSGSITRLSGVVHALERELDGGKVIFTLDSGEGGYCELHGLRLIIADSLDEVAPLLGEEIEVSVEIEDPVGDVGIGTRWLTLSDDIIGL